MAYLIDTDIILYRLKGDEKIKLKFGQLRLVPKYISVITYGELIYRAKNSANKEKNLERVHQIETMFEILFITKSIMELFSDLRGSLEAQKINIKTLDLMKACAALNAKYTFVTTNTGLYKNIPGLTLENWRK